MDFNEFNFTYAHMYWLFLLPLIGAASDIITGWIQASVNGTWDSTKMRKGLYRKGGEFLVVVLAFIIECAIPVIGDMHVATGISWYIVLMEILSVIENLDQAGVPVPPFLHNKLKKLKDKADAGEFLTEGE